MNTFGTSYATRQAAINGLAVVGFVALVGAGMWLAISSTRFVPGAVNRLGAAAVYLTQILTPGSEEPALSVVPTASTTIPFGTTTEPIIDSPAAPATTTPAKPATPHWTPGTPADVPGTPSATTIIPVSYYGLPDLALTLESVGYLTNASSTETLIATTTIPAGAQIAVKFRVTNTGTNVSGPWVIRISVPSEGSALTQTFAQAPLVPSQPSEYVARIGNVTPGSGRVISISVDPDNTVTESNEGNNTASTTLTVLGAV